MENKNSEIIEIISKKLNTSDLKKIIKSDPIFPTSEFNDKLYFNPEKNIYYECIPISQERMIKENKKKEENKETINNSLKIDIQTNSEENEINSVTIPDFNKKTNQSSKKFDENLNDTNLNNKLEDVINSFKIQFTNSQKQLENQIQFLIQDKMINNQKIDFLIEDKMINDKKIDVLEERIHVLEDSVVKLKIITTIN